MEYLDTYDENKNYLGEQTRDYVHANALWHNTVHCWLYDSTGNIYFQIRSDEKTLYTTASGHVAAKETIKEAFGREIKEEIGIDIDYEQAELVDIVIWKMDKEKKDGTMFRDRAFANVYVYKYDDEDYNKFKFDNELDGIVKVNAKEALDLFKQEKGAIPGVIILKGINNNTKEERKIDFNEFLVNKHETAIGKYGDILNKVIFLTSSK